MQLYSEFIRIDIMLPTIKQWIYSIIIKTGITVVEKMWEGFFYLFSVIYLVGHLWLGKSRGHVLWINSIEHAQLYQFLLIVLSNMRSCVHLQLDKFLSLHYCWLKCLQLFLHQLQITLRPCLDNLTRLEEAVLNLLLQHHQKVRRIFWRWIFDLAWMGTGATLSTQRHISHYHTETTFNQ